MDNEVVDGPAHVEELNVLLVEPSGMQGRHIARALNESGVEYVTRVESGQQTLDRVVEVQPDVIVSAMYLPDMTGTELLLALREIEQFSNVMFMLISSETRMSQLEPLRQAGVVALLPKPFTPENLQVALDNTVNLLSPDTHEWDEDRVARTRILLVDDSAVARKFLVQNLAKMGLTDVVEAHNGREAIDYLQADEFDLVIADYNMPELDGFGLLQFIRKEYRRKDLPVMMVTSEQDETKLAAIESAGVSALLDKPMVGGNMHDIIGSMIGL
ncbi:MAG: response regulator [Immundisolibacteraceae bacterium]|nr:response regulator [Immundisolibacteraceae bacterium]